jgi:hypothetical protein
VSGRQATASGEDARRMLLAAILRRDVTAADLQLFDAAVVCAAAEVEGVVGLAADALSALADLPDVWRQVFAARARYLATLDVLREAGLREVVLALDRVNAGALLMKGAALAYSHYTRPDLRPRLDSDLLVPSWARERSRVVLERLGFRAIGQQSGDLLMYQTCFERARAGLTETIDLHWRALNPHVFADVLGYRDLAATAVGVPALGRGARALGPVHALVLACTHLFAHHDGDPRLIWLHDIHLLAQSLGPADWQHFIVTIERDRVAAICRSGLELAAEIFDTPLPRGLFGDYRAARTAGERTAAYTRRRRHAAVAWDDFQALRGWRARARLAAQYMFPRADYMRNTYAPGSRLPLPLLYAKRIWRGAWKWMAPPRPRRSAA